MGETTSSVPHSRTHDKGQNPFHRKNRAPRRTRFSGRTTPGDESLDTHTTIQAAKELKDTSTAIPAPESAAPPTALETTESSANAPATAATPTALADSPCDIDLCVDAPEIGPRNRRSTRFLGERLYDKLGPSVTYVCRSASFLITSPDRLTIVAPILIIAILAAGLSIWQTTSQRRQQLTRISQLSEPMANASRNLYASLAIADASANTALSRGTLNSNQDLVSNFDDVIAQVSISTTRAATGIENVDDSEVEDIATVQRLLPVYTGTVKIAHANAHQGSPISVAYLASASDLMQVQILPAAKSLYERISTTTNEEQRELSKPPLFPMSGLATAILMLLITQWWLTRRTGRLFNVGLFGATMLMAITLVGVGIATT